MVALKTVGLKEVDVVGLIQLLQCLLSEIIQLINRRVLSMFLVKHNLDFIQIKQIIKKNLQHLRKLLTVKVN